jgi:hypothetical protein
MAAATLTPPSREWLPPSASARSRSIEQAVVEYLCSLPPLSAARQAALLKFFPDVVAAFDHKGAPLVASGRGGAAVPGGTSPVNFAFYNGRTDL